MSTAFWIFIIIAACLTIYFHTDAGRSQWKGIRSNVVMFFGGLIPVLDQVMAHFQVFQWDAYLDKAEALIAHVVSITLGAWFSALKRTDK